jgi:uncharacterized membrane protein YjjB (DUF3815 family)
VVTHPFGASYFPLFTIMAALAFAIDLHVSPKHYPIALTTSFIGGCGSKWGVAYLGVHAGTLLTALVIALVSNLYARYVPPYVSLVGLIPGILLLVPGAMGIRAFFTASLLDPASGVGIILGVMLIAIQLAVAVVLANSLVPLRGAFPGSAYDNRMRMKVKPKKWHTLQAFFRDLFRFQWRTPKSGDTLGEMLREQTKHKGKRG